MSRDPVAPDVVIVGAARAGTSFLSATLTNHPDIDGGAVKEPNFYSSRWSEGREWYDGLFEPRSSGRLRLDSSVSYTYPQHLTALPRLHEANPDVQIVYMVREPVARLVSHFQLMRYYVGHEKWPTLSDAVAGSEMFISSGAYDVWLPRLRATFPPGNVLVVPFPAVTRDVAATSEVILRRIGLEAPVGSLAAPSFRNEVREFRSPFLKRAHRRAIKSRYYPVLRSRLGADRLRRLRGAMTRAGELPSADLELATLSDQQVAELESAASRAAAAVSDWLAEQDQVLGLDWLSLWEEHTAHSPLPRRRG